MKGTITKLNLTDIGAELGVIVTFRSDISKFGTPKYGTKEYNKAKQQAEKQWKEFISTIKFGDVELIYKE